MITKGRLTPEGAGGDFVGELMSDNRGIRVDHMAMPAFWLEILLEPEDIDKLATQSVFVLTRAVEDGIKIVGIYRRLGDARRVAWCQPRPSGCGLQKWFAVAQKDTSVKLLIQCADTSIRIQEFKIL